MLCKSTSTSLPVISFATSTARIIQHAAAKQSISRGLRSNLTNEFHTGTRASFWVRGPLRNNFGSKSYGRRVTDPSSRLENYSVTAGHTIMPNDGPVEDSDSSPSAIGNVELHTASVNTSGTSSPPELQKLLKAYCSAETITNKDYFGIDCNAIDSTTSTIIFDSLIFYGERKILSGTENLDNTLDVYRIGATASNDSKTTVATPSNGEGEVTLEKFKVDVQSFELLLDRSSEEVTAGGLRKKLKVLEIGVKRSIPGSGTIKEARRLYVIDENGEERLWHHPTKLDDVSDALIAKHAMKVIDSFEVDARQTPAE